MNGLRTLGRIAAGFVLACLMAGLTQVLFVWTPADLATLPANEFGGRAASGFELALLAATHTAIFAVAFAMIAIVVAEWLTIRTPAYYLAAGTIIALLGFYAQFSSEVAGQATILNPYAAKAYLTSGFFAGLVYWLTAGQFAGGDEGGALSDDDGGETTRTVTAAPDTQAALERPRILVKKQSSSSDKEITGSTSLSERLLQRDDKTAETKPVDAPRAASKDPKATDAATQPKPEKPAAPAQSTAVPVTRAQPDGNKAAPSSTSDPLPKVLQPKNA
ncbi:MAG: hypothetical protein ACRCS9_14570 [Hyphomicrobium sp.]